MDRDIYAKVIAKLKTLEGKLSEGLVLKSIDVSGTTDTDGYLATGIQSAKAYPIAFLAGTGSADVVMFVDGSETAGYQKFLYFLNKKSTAVTGTVVYLEGDIKQEVTP